MVAGACTGGSVPSTGKGDRDENKKAFRRSSTRVLRPDPSPSREICGSAGVRLRLGMPCRTSNKVRRLRRVDELPVWSISCFYIRIGYRKRGVTTALIEAAVELARAARAPAIEAYPLDADLTPSSSSTGYASNFLRAGFQEVARYEPPRPILRKIL